MSLGDEGAMLTRIQQFRDHRNKVAIDKAHHLGLTTLNPAQQARFESEYWDKRLKNGSATLAATPTGPFTPPNRSLMRICSASSPHRERWHKARNRPAIRRLLPQLSLPRPWLRRIRSSLEKPFPQKSVILSLSKDQLPEMLRS